MTNNTVTRAQLADAVHRNVRLSRAESAALVEMMLNEITACLDRGEAVKLSSFGTFLVRAKAARVGRNPKTGIQAPIAARRVLVFKPSPIFKHRVMSVSDSNRSADTALEVISLPAAAGQPPNRISPTG